MDDYTIIRWLFLCAALGLIDKIRWPIKFIIMPSILIYTLPSWLMNTGHIVSAIVLGVTSQLIVFFTARNKLRDATDTDWISYLFGIAFAGYVANFHFDWLK
jgi:hypothetical protein